MTTEQAVTDGVIDRMAKLEGYLAQLGNAVNNLIESQQKQASAPAVTKSAPNVGKNGRNLDAKDRAIVSGFKRKGISDVTLMNRADPKAKFNVRPYRGWLEQGRQVRKGEHGVRGLFHVSQTDAIAKKTN